MAEYSVLDLVVGLNQEQVRTFQELVVPVLRELRKCIIDTGEKKIIIDLEQLSSNSKKNVAVNPSQKVRLG